MLATTIPSDIPQVAVPPRASVRHLPVNLFGAVMSLAGLAMAWRLAGRSLGAPAVIGEAIAVLALGVFLLLGGAYLSKLLRHRDAVKAEFAHPILGNFFGTIAISLLLLSSLVQPYGAAAAQAMWGLGSAATLLLAYVAAVRLLRGGRAPRDAVPALLIPGVAALDIPVTGAQMTMAWAAELNLAALAIGGVQALLLLSLVFARLVQQPALAAGLKPSLMILVAPFAVGFLAYTNVVGEVDRVASLLFYFGVFAFLLVAPQVFRRDVPFVPGWWAIGFPMAALANAALKYAEAHAALPLMLLAGLLLAVLSLAIAVLVLRTLRSLIDGSLLKA